MEKRTRKILGSVPVAVSQPASIAELVAECLFFLSSATASFSWPQAFRIIAWLPAVNRHHFTAPTEPRPSNSRESAGNGYPVPAPMIGEGLEG